MRVIDVLETEALNTPWPMVVGERTWDGRDHQISPLCERKCFLRRRCADEPAQDGEYVCVHGLSYFRVMVSGEPVTIFGMRGPANPNGSNPRLKAFLRGRSLDWARVKSWTEKIETLLSKIEEEFLRRQSEMLDPLHDPIRLARQIAAIADRLLTEQHPNRPYEEQIRLASRELKSLIKAAGLLNDSFDLLAIYFNPAAASFGRRSYISLHGLLMKIVRVLERRDAEDDAFSDNGVRIYLGGETYKKIHVYESFKLVPLALISNAVKYCLRGSVNVELIERSKGIEVAVESYGPWIEPDELDTIFEKRVRGKWAREVEEGTGVGLYLARIVARANGFEIHVSSRREGNVRVRGVPLALNRFWFEIPTGESR